MLHFNSQFWLSTENKKLLFGEDTDVIRVCFANIDSHDVMICCPGVEAALKGLFPVYSVEAVLKGLLPIEVNIEEMKRLADCWTIHYATRRKMYLDGKYKDLMALSDRHGVRDTPKVTGDYIDWRFSLEGEPQ